MEHFSYDFLIGIGTGVAISMAAVWIINVWYARKHTLILDDPTDDEEYLEIVRQLKCPDCDSTDFRYEEVSDLKWIQGEDRFCICNHCGRRFSDGK